MVSKSFSTSSTIKTSHKIFRLACFAFILALSTFVLVFFLLRFLSAKQLSDDGATNTDLSGEIIDESSSEAIETAVQLPKEISFQTAIDTFVQSANGNKSVLIYDLDRQEIAGEYNSNETYSTASLYKLFVVYEGYRRIEKGEWDKNEIAGLTGRTIIECLDAAIRSSNSPCAETLWNKIGHAALDDIIASDFDINNSDISHLLSNPEDILAIIKLFYNHPDIKSDELVARIKDSFINQPIVGGYDWRQGLPSGFAEANVYNKVGWDFNPSINGWNIYHDAAIVEFPEQNRHFIVVVMTNYVPFQKITKLGADIEELFLQSQ